MTRICILGTALILASVLSVFVVFQNGSAAVLSEDQLKAIVGGQGDTYKAKCDNPITCSTECSPLGSGYYEFVTIPAYCCGARYHVNCVQNDEDIKYKCARYVTASSPDCKKDRTETNSYVVVTGCAGNSMAPGDVEMKVVDCPDPE